MFKDVGKIMDRWIAHHHGDQKRRVLPVVSLNIVLNMEPSKEIITKNLPFSFDCEESIIDCLKICRWNITKHSVFIQRCRNLKRYYIIFPQNGL